MKKKRKLPFGGSDHIRIVKAIAYGLNRAGALNRYLELGIRTGNCFNEVAPFAKEAYAVDINDCFKYIKSNKNLYWFREDTLKFLSNHNRDKKFDLVFIDADHKYESSLADFENSFPLVNENGLILLHDTYPTREELISKKYCGDSYKTAEVIRKEYSNECEIVTLPFYYGISVVRKMKLGKQLLWK